MGALATADQTDPDLELRVRGVSGELRLARPEATSRSGEQRGSRSSTGEFPRSTNDS